MTAPASAGRDPGLAAERTQLAWSRSTLALFAFGAAVAKGLPNLTGTPGRPLAGLIVCAFGAVVWLTSVPYARARARGGRPSAVVRRRAIATMAIGTTVVGVGALLLELVFAP